MPAAALPAEERQGENQVISGESSETSRDGAEERNCEDPDWRLTPENWEKFELDQWLLKWSQNQTAVDMGLVRAISAEFAPALDSFTCDLDHACEIRSCDEITPHPEEHQAYLALTSFAHFNDFMRFYAEGITIAQTHDNSLGPGMIKAFSQAGSPPPDTMVTREILNAVATFLAIPMALFPEIAVLATVAGPALSKMVLLNAGTPGGLATGINIRLSSSKTLLLDEFSNVGNLIASLSEQARDSLQSDNTALLAGKQDASKSYLREYLAGGAFTRQIVNPGASIKEYLIPLYAASIINTLWKSQHTYIMMADTDDCEADTRGPRESKHCRKDDKHVYYAYYAHMDGRVMFPQISAPYGYDKLSSYSDLNLSIVMESSINAYNAHQFTYDDVRADRWTSALLDTQNGGSPLDLGPRMEGVFTIPVCYDPEGQFIGPIDARLMKRKQPCKCGQGGIETGAFADAAGFMGEGWWQSQCMSGMY
ncbi:MAG: hypothetical protein M1837_002451 [Sclerophora amabilis]|nr:MAG: hypothetical protein M1837_002451 [Sclerophora amabilis]